MSAACAPESTESGSSASGEQQRKAAPGSALLAPGSLIDGKYEVLGLLGQGGMGTVFAAKNRMLDSVVAIKVLGGDSADEGGRAERLIREARLAARISHPNVVRVLDVGSLESGAPFVVMERLFGTDLEGMLRQQGPLRPARAAALLIEACRGLAAAHDLGLVHRDLKPANLFWSEGEPHGPALKVLDFGVSKLVPRDGAVLSGLTREGTVLGSPHYMSPEQLRNSGDVDHASDIWALGVILFRLVTGRYVFDAPSLPALAVAIASDTPDTASAGQALPRPLRLIVQRCLEKAPSRRFASVRELELALQSYVEPATPGTGRLLRFAAAAIGVASCVCLAWWAAHRQAPATLASSPPASVALEPAPVVAAQVVALPRERSLEAAPRVQPAAPSVEPKGPRVSKLREPETPLPAVKPTTSTPASAATPTQGTGVDGSLRDQSAVYDRK